MKAARYHQHGTADLLQIEEAPEPKLRGDEVLVRQMASSVNPSDWKFMEGWYREWVPQPLPFIPGSDVAGVVEAAGALVADRFRPGMRVFGMMPVPQGGAFAEYVAVKADALAELPDSIDWHRAAATPLAALTAWMALFTDGRLQAGETVLVQAASGGVGSFATRLAHLAGARVIATCSAANSDMVRALGADQVIDHHQPDALSAVRDADLVLDAVGGSAGAEARNRLLGCARTGGRVVTLDPVPFDADRVKAAGVTAVATSVAPNGGCLATIASLMAEGRITPLIDSVVALSDAAGALARSRTGRARGKIVITIGNGADHGT